MYKSNTRLVCLLTPHKTKARNNLRRIFLNLEEDTVSGTYQSASVLRIKRDYRALIYHYQVLLLPLLLLNPVSGQNATSHATSAAEHARGVADMCGLCRAIHMLVIQVWQLLFLLYLDTAPFRTLYNSNRCPKTH